MSKYIGEFTSINGIDYKIEITSSNGSKTENVILGSTPFTTTMDDNDSIYQPIKASGATITILTNSLPSDIYSNSAKGSKVKVTSDNRIVWMGYLTPCAYTQGYDMPFEELQLECVDGLSVLKDLPYQCANKDISNFIDIVFNCLKQSECFKNLYVSNILQRISIWNDGSPLDDFKISNGNFFEQKDYDNQPDSDVAWSCYDVLEQIAQYLGYTITVQGEDVYMLDYDGIVASSTSTQYKHTYIKYDISGSTLGNQQLVTLEDSYKIKDDSYSETGTTITLTPVYNKLTIKDDFYEIEDQFESIDNAKNLTNITSQYDIWEDLMKNDSGRYKECALFTETNGEGEKESFFVAIIKNGDNYFFVIGKFYKNPTVETFQYTMNNVAESASKFDPMKYSYLLDNKGAWQVGYFVQVLDNDIYDKWKFNPNVWRAKSLEDKKKAFAQLTNISNFGKKSLTNYILCLNPNNNFIPTDKTLNYPFVKITKPVSIAHGGEGSYLVIKGSLIRHSVSSCPFPMQGKAGYHKDESKTSMYEGESYFFARLKWGNKYWANDSYKTPGEWKDVPTYFKLYYGTPAKEQRMDVFYDKELKFYSTANLWGVDEDGVVIRCPEGENLTGNIEFTIYANRETKGKWARNNKKDKKNSYSGYPPYVVLLKDLSMELGFTDDALNEDAASEDTYYSNEVEESYICEADEIEYKICTHDDKTPSYSTVTTNGIGEANNYLDKVWRKDNQMQMRMEEHFIYKFVEQYQKPRIKFSLNLKADIGFTPYTTVTSDLLPNKKFVIDAMSTDYRFNKTTLTLIEK